MRRPKIRILSAGYGNTLSVAAALQKAGARVVTREADGYVLPGVGAFDTAAANLDETRIALAEGKPFLGICLGMQLLFDSGSEGRLKGLGVLSGRVRRLRSGKWPHVGWNTVSGNGVLLEGVREPWFYFVHGYACPDTRFAKGWTEFGRRFASVVENGNVLGVQFHPEKSGKAGLTVMQNFVEVVSKWR